MTAELDFRKQEGGLTKRLVWTTDLHLDAIDKTQYLTFYELLMDKRPDIILVGGDISNGLGSLNHLSQLLKFAQKPIYYVLGNHDYYNTSIAKVRLESRHLSETNPQLVYLTDSGVIPLSNHTALVGHDGWADGRAGDFINSEVLLNDYFLIEELQKLSQEKRLQKLNDLGQEAAKHFREQLTNAFKEYDRVVLLTHVPPFVEACIHEGQPCDDNWSPHFVCQVAGEVLEDMMIRYPSKELLVLCGHTHCGSDINILPNLRIVAGQSELGIPQIQGIVLID